MSAFWMWIWTQCEKVTGIRTFYTPEMLMEEERVICDTWLTEEPKGIYAFARINGVTYYRPGYFISAEDGWSTGE